MKTLIAIACLTVASAFFLEREAQAATAIVGRLCSISYNGNASGYGASGYVQISVYAGNDCSGASLGSFLLCSENATDGACAANQSYRFTSTSLPVLAQMLLSARQQNTKFTFSKQICNTGSLGCMGPFTFAGPQ